MISIPEAAKQLGSTNQVEAFRARMALRAATERAAGAADRRTVAEALAREFSARAATPNKGRPGTEPTHSVQARERLALFLGLVGDDAQVPVLAAALDDLDVRDAARMALDRIPTAAATAALVAALDRVGPEFLCGVIGSLAKRQGAEVAAALGKAAGDQGDARIRLAAIEALANFPDAANDRLMAAAARTGPPWSRDRVQRARIHLAENLARSGAKKAAAAIYRSIAGSDASRAQKRAAAIGMKQLG